MALTPMAALSTAAFHVLLLTARAMPVNAELVNASFGAVAQWVQAPGCIG